MKNVINFAAVLVLFPLSWGISLVHAQANTEKAATNNESTPDAPDAIQVPAGEKVVLFARGVGSQIYTCQEGKDHKLAWILNAPDAELKDRNDKVIGQHFAGPSWKLKDGSEVTGKATAKVESLDPESVPWLLVSVVSHSGNGTLSNVNYIQRLHTHGGQPPAQGCDQAHTGAETKSSYSADYYFYAPQ
ncbi:MAG: DUF3455 domain-containing protein [Candidatus Sulfotelmatobacter sp.]